MELEQRLERLERAMKGLWIGFAVGLAAAGLAFLLSLVALFHRPADRRAEQPAPEQPEPEARKTSYLDELERLETLKTRGAITQQEFEAKKQQLLAAAPPKPADKSSDMDELDRQLRNLHGLWNKNVINNPEYQKQKAQYLQRKLAVIDLAKDLEKAQRLWNESILTGPEFETLKRSLLAADPAAGKK